MPIIPSFILSLIPSNSNSNSQNQNHSSSSPSSDQDSDIIPAGTVTIQQTFNNGQQIPPTITEPLNMVVPITKLSMKPLNAEPPKTEPFPSVVVAQPMEITSAPSAPVPAANANGTANASTAPPEAVSTGAGTGTETEKGVKRSQSKRLSKNPGPGPGASKKNTQAYNAFWRKLIGITPKGA
ncbi:hypothetical protein B0H65DRAFT_142535 [Neurospora tetraspora]|uniref:Uncharacterized protein n=1 Tax=Neurospora tetraspora TaxID=94610 RepID=A0AAE0JM95_9PEZI|nr:hypothetical protein B0H65DRAFT_142535 [Neurospora tetraspora]